MKSVITRFRILRYGLFGFALIFLALAHDFAPARMSEVPGISIENFAKVDDHYYRGSQPNEEQFGQLKRFGIKTVIDLREDYKKDAEASVRSLEMQYFRIPLKTRVAATEAQTNSFLKLVNDPANWPVYVHCKGGRHRTGAMTGIYRITHDGWSADQAWQEMKAYDFNNGLFGGPPAQKKFVFSFYQQQHASAPVSQR